MIDACARVGRMESVSDLLEDMKKHGVRPNLITFSTMIKGHCQSGDIQTAFSLLEQMQAAGVQPSNFTLSVLVKLMNRARKLDQAFGLVQEISQKYNFKPNVHVYTNLIQACTSNRQLTRAMETLETMLRNNVYPES